MLAKVHGELKGKDMAVFEPQQHGFSKGLFEASTPPLLSKYHLRSGVQSEKPPRASARR